MALSSWSQILRRSFNLFRNSFSSSDILANFVFSAISLLHLSIEIIGFGFWKTISWLVTKTPCGQFCEQDGRINQVESLPTAAAHDFQHAAYPGPLFRCHRHKALGRLQVWNRFNS